MRIAWLFAVTTACGEVAAPVTPDAPSDADPVITVRTTGTPLLVAVRD